MVSSGSYYICREDFLIQQAYRITLATVEFLPDRYRCLAAVAGGAGVKLTYHQFVDTSEYQAHLTHILRSNRRESDDLFDRPHGTHN